MQFKTLLFTAGLAAATTPTPEATPTATPGVVATPAAFHLLAIRSGSNLQYSSFKAALGSVFLNLPQSNASCDATTDDAATFSLTSDGELYLYKTDNPPQQFYADRSGMGQGRFGYTTGAQSPGRNSERKGFTIDADGGLSFDGSSFVACPNSVEGSWGVRLYTEGGVNAKNCTGIKARVVEVKNPIGCLYTS